MAVRGRKSADEILAAELAAGRTIRAAAAAAGVSERTAARRLTDPAFKRQVTELRGRMVNRAAGKLAAGMSAAAGVLRKLLASTDEDVRHKAAVKVLELSLKVSEVAELEKRIEELEARLLGTEGQQP